MSAVQDAITQAAQEEGVDPAFALAVADRESSFNPNARNSRSIYGLFQMRGDLRSQYGAGDSSDPYTQTKAWARFINDTKGQLAQRIGRDPTNDELYLAHYFGEGRAARMIGGGIAPSTSVRDVFTPQEIAGNPNIARAGTVGALTSSIGADMERRQAKYGGGVPQGTAGNTDFASFGQPEQGSQNAEALPQNDAIPHSVIEAPDFASFGVAQGNSQTGPDSAGPQGEPIDFAQYGTAQIAPGNSQAVPGAQGAEPSALAQTATNFSGAQGVGPGTMPTGLMSHGMDTSDFRPSTNVEDDRSRYNTGSPAADWSKWAFENTFEMGTDTFGKMLQHPLTPMRQLQGDQSASTASDNSGTEVDVSQFGLPNTADALKNIKPWPSAPPEYDTDQTPQVPVTGL